MLLFATVPIFPPSYYSFSFFLASSCPFAGNHVMNKRLRGVAQSGSAPALGAGCRGFESLLPDHISRVLKRLYKEI